MLIDMIDSGIARADKYNEFADQITNTPSVNKMMNNRNSSNLMMGGANDDQAAQEDHDPWAIE